MEKSNYEKIMSMDKVDLAWFIFSIYDAEDDTVGRKVLCKIIGSDEIYDYDEESILQWLNKSTDF